MTLKSTPHKSTPLRSMLAAATVLLAIGASGPAMAHDAGETVTPQFDQAIPNIPGKSLVAVTVHYAPGAASPAHAHATSAFIFAYVLVGTIESQVDDGPVEVYHAGQSFRETPGALHRVTRNASPIQPAELLAVFVVDTDDKPLTTPMK